MDHMVIVLTHSMTIAPVMEAIAIHIHHLAAIAMQTTRVILILGVLHIVVLAIARLEIRQCIHMHHILVGQLYLMSR